MSAFVHDLYAQTVENITLDFDGNRMSITYDLTSSSADQKFSISLFSSHNNYNEPITYVSGDVGDNVVAGKQKKVIWNLKRELPVDFNDEIAIKVKAIPIANYSLNPMANGYKKGGVLQVLWEGGLPNELVKIDLLKNNVFQQTLTETKNNKSYTWDIPKEFEKGSGYTVRLTNMSDEEQSISSTSFRIKPRLPLALKIAPVVLVGVLVGILSGGGDSSDDTNGNSNELPGPISPGG